MKFSSEDLVEIINDKLYTEPLLFLSRHNNPFKLKERKFPVNFDTPWKDKNSIVIEILKGYKVEKLPQSLGMELPNKPGVFKYQVTQKKYNNRNSAITV